MNTTNRLQPAPSAEIVKKLSRVELNLRKTGITLWLRHEWGDINLVLMGDFSYVVYEQFILRLIHECDVSDFIVIATLTECNDLISQKQAGWKARGLQGP